MNNTIEKLLSTADAQIKQSAPTTNAGSVTFMGVGSGLTSLVKFDLSSIPATATVSEAVFTLHVFGIGNVASIDTFRLVRDWTESEVTWNIAKTAVNWGTAGANNVTTDFVNTNLGTMSFVATAFTFDSITITQTVQDWVDGTNSNFGLKLFFNTSDRSFNTREFASNLKPSLTVTYTYPALDFQLNSNNIDSGIQAHWAPIPTGKKADATQRTNTDWRRHVWNMAFCEMDVWETLEPTKGTSFSELKTTGESAPNVVDTFSTGRVLDVTGRHVGRRMENVKINFLVNITS